MRCPICESPKVTIIDTEIRNQILNETKAYKCSNCEIHFLHPYQTDDEIKEFYDGEYRREYTDENYHFDSIKKETFIKFLPEAKQRVDRVKKLVSKNDDILEIGCASGYFLETIKQDVSNVYGLELDKSNIEFCNKINIIVKSELHSFNIKFDKIFMFHVLEHINNPIEYLKNLKKYLKKDGLLFIEVPNNDDALLSLYNIQEFRDFYYQNAHLWYFNDKSLNYVLDKSGYNIDINFIQRYGLSNHLNWLSNKKPGDNKLYNEFFNKKLDKDYRENIIENKKSDTIFAICNLKEELYDD